MGLEAETGRGARGTDADERHTAVVTGGASGLGRAFCHLLAAHGYRAVIVDTDGPGAETVAAEIRESNGCAEARIADVTSWTAVQGIAADMQAREWLPSLLVLCAGDVHVGALAEIEDLSGVRRDIEVDLWGAIVCCHCFGPLLAPGSQVLMISSGFGLFGAAGYAGYCAAKAGLIHFAEGLRRELLYRRVHVHVACPGDMDTPMYRRELAQQPGWMKTASARYLVKSPEDVA
ncbi:MAG: SDR family NAD(P)-dependent oxidoreductase, partial [Chitinivibrionales bacterium]|nr:SDR family NAD(P)-dependent oxidoreductase [Chitinivibrionales bacterium]